MRNILREIGIFISEFKTPIIVGIFFIVITMSIIQVRQHQKESVQPGQTWVRVNNHYNPYIKIPTDTIKIIAVDGKYVKYTFNGNESAGRRVTIFKTSQLVK